MKSIAVLLLTCALLQARQKPAGPNVIVIFTDDHGYADLSCAGSETDVKTPHLDRLAAEGVRFTDGYVTAPQCCPSRAGLLTGRDQNRFGFGPTDTDPCHSRQPPSPTDSAVPATSPAWSASGISIPCSDRPISKKPTSGTV